MYTAATEVMSEDRESLDRSPSDRSLAAKLEVGRLDLLIAIVAGLLTVLWIPRFLAATLPRNALALGLFPIGIGYLVARARRRSLPALLGVACCCAFVVAGLQAESPRTAFAGQVLEWGSVIGLATSIAWWAVGRELSENGRELVVWSLTAGALLNGVTGLAQLLVGAQQSDLVAVPGRASGLMVNPVYYGAFMVGMAALWTARASVDPRRWSVGLSTMLTFLAALSGSRVGLLALVAVWIVAIVAWGRASLITVAGGFVGALSAEVVMRVTGDASSVTRFGSKGGDGRLDVWEAGLRAFGERPLFGWGPSNVELAVQPRLGFEFARRYWTDGPVVIWSDPHNVLVLFLVSTGAVGTLLALGFLVSALRGRRNGPLLIGAAAMSSSWLLQPFTIHSVPIALLLLGMAVRPDDRAGDESRDPFIGHRSFGKWGPLALTGGALLTTVALVAGFLATRAVNSSDPDRAAAVTRVFGGDPSVDRFISEEYLNAFASSDRDETLLRKSLDYAERAARTFPTTSNHIAVARVAIVLDDVSLAQDALERAIAAQPWDPRARQLMYAFASAQGDEELAEEQASVLCALSDGFCPAGVGTTSPSGDPGGSAEP